MASPRQLIKTTSPAIAIFAITFIISIATGQIPDLFHANSTRGFVIRTFLIIAILVPTVFIALKIVSTLAFFMKEKTPFGQLVKTKQPRETELQRIESWLLRPIQGIGLCLIAGESLIEFLEYGTGVSYSYILARISFFILGSLVVAITLSVVWTLDDLGQDIFTKW
jgi:hypothetical protein